MPSTYSDLKVELIATGEQTNTWGATTNTNLSTALGEAITGSADVAFSSADVTLTLTNVNTAQTARNLRLNLTGTSGGARQLILGSGCQIEKLYLINNGLADTVTVKNTTGTGIAVPAGRTTFVFNNGTNVVDAITYLSSLNTNVVTDPHGGSIAPTSSVMRNRIINGGMVIDQRYNGGIFFQGTGSSGYIVDRWSTFYTQVGAFNSQQNAGAVTPPVGFTNYLGTTAQSSYTVGAGDFFTFQQSIEGYNWADLGFGTASAKSITLSFWVRSSLTGTFGGSIRNFDGTRSYPFTYTISAANTWEFETITIPGDTSGTWQKTISIGATVFFGLGVGTTFSGTAGSWSGGNFLSATGAVSVVGTSGATFYITGVQVEKGTQATSFEYRLYQQELALCQRYFYATSVKPLGIANTTSNTYQIGTNLPVTMRGTPTLSAVPTAVFVVSAGTAGTPALNPNATAGTTNPDWAALYNSAANWTAGSYVAFTGGLSAEL